MAIFPAYEYDIYISYHHNDAILAWVTEFTEKLQGELDATIRDTLSIYYDKQGVGAELNKEEFDRKRTRNLKSLIFIPVISHTYCDTKKYNWKKEFQEFKQMASSDATGLDIELESGTIISRILPVKIHNVEKKDIQLLEKELGGSMRSVDFIYDSLEGVNRPLHARDDEMAYRMNTVLYRNQINKTANAIAALIKNIKEKQAGKDETEENPAVKDDSSKHTVFLAWAAPDCIGRRDELSLILQKAGMDVIPITDCPSDDEAIKSKIAHALSRSHCSVHLLGAVFGSESIQTAPDRETDNVASLPLYQVDEVRKKIADNGTNFKQFIWQCPVDYSKDIEPAQQEFINDIRNNITSNMIFTNVPTPMQLVDDIRASLAVKEKPVVEVNDTEIFLIGNQLDDEDTKEITDLLNDVVLVESLIISQDRDEDYGEKVVQQIKKSKLAVIYFKEASGWALPFIQQIWKMIGGASSNTPVLLIGDDAIEANRDKQFNAPKAISKIVAKDLIALEIKATYDKVLEGSI